MNKNSGFGGEPAGLVVGELDFHPVAACLKKAELRSSVKGCLEALVVGFTVAFASFDRKMKGYYTNDALVLGTESRTSSPVRIPRDPETMCVCGLEGLYPCGEGAGYAGGIVSSAMDGILVAAAASAR